MLLSKMCRAISEKCGEVFYTASVAERLEKIIEHVQTVASKIFICDYANVA